MTVQPHEPVSGGWTGFDAWSWNRRRAMGCMDDCFVVATAKAPLHVTLANGQRIIVKALSEERKAARLIRLAHKLGAMRSQEEMDRMSRDFEYARANAESGANR